MIANVNRYRYVVAVLRVQEAAVRKIAFIKFLELIFLKLKAGE